MSVEQFLTIDYWMELWNSHGRQIGFAVARIAATVVGYYLARFLVFRLIRRVLTSKVACCIGEELVHAREARVRALQTVLRSIAGFILAFIAAIMILSAVGLNIVPLLTTASVAGLAVGFGAQKLVRDVISGFFILVEDQYGVGDYIKIGVVEGLVEEMGMRTTRVRDRTGKLFIIANGDIGQVCNFSRGKLLTTMDVAVPAASDIEKAKQVLNEVGRAAASDLQDWIKEPFTCEGLAQVTGAVATLRLEGAVIATRQQEVEMEMKSRIRDAFNSADLKLA